MRMEILCLRASLKNESRPELRDKRELGFEKGLLSFSLISRRELVVKPAGSGQ